MLFVRCAEVNAQVDSTLLISRSPFVHCLDHYLLFANFKLTKGAFPDVELPRATYLR